MTDPADDIDPTIATTPEELAHCLQRLRARNDLSYRELESWGQDHGQPLPRTTVLEVLHGRRFPKKSFLLAFVEACGVDTATDTRWERTWSRLSEQVRVPVSAAPVVPVDNRVDMVEDLPDATDIGAGPANPAEVWEQAQELLQQARKAISAAQAEADRVREQARAEADRVREQARAEADRIREQARAEAAGIRSTAERDAAQIRQTARDRAEREAVREADELKKTILADLATDVDEFERHRSAARTQGSGRTDKRTDERMDERTSKDPEQRRNGKPGRRGWFGRS